jgi:hypothetical protein
MIPHNLTEPWGGSSALSIKTNTQKATLSIVAIFPKGYFLENLAVRSDNSLLVTSLKTHELWYVPPARPGEQVEPKLLFTFDTSPTSMVEPEPDAKVARAFFQTVWRQGSLHRPVHRDISSCRVQCAGRNDENVMAHFYFLQPHWLGRLYRRLHSDRVFFGEEWKFVEAWLGPTWLYLILSGITVIVLGVIFRHSLSEFFCAPLLSENVIGNNGWA